MEVIECGHIANIEEPEECICYSNRLLYDSNNKRIPHALPIFKHYAYPCCKTVLPVLAIFQCSFFSIGVKQPLSDIC